MIRLGTIGTSKICSDFLSGAFLTDEYSLCAVYSRREETGKAFALERGCNTVFTSLEEMADSNIIDAVYIASPNVFHGAQSRIFLERGKHVICEKPVATSAEEYKELKALADSKGLIYMEAIIPRHIADYKAVKNALSEIGEIQSARIDYSQRSSRMEKFYAGEHVNIFDMSLHAGTLMDLGVYCVYGAVDLLGVPKKITAFKSLLENGADGSGCAVFEYENFNAVLSYSKTGLGCLGSEIIGDKGVLKIDFISQYSGVTLVKDTGETSITGYPSKAEQMKGEAQRFADYIRDFENNREDYNSVSELAYKVHSCMDKMKKSAGLFYSDAYEK